MKNISRKVFTRDGTTGTTFTVPAGVKKLKVNFQEDADDDVHYPLAGIDDAGALFVWGPAPCGDGTAVNRSDPGFAQNTNIGRISPFLKTDGTMYNWGDNTYGQVGDNTIITRSTQTIVLGGHTFKKVFRGGQTCFGLTVGGDLYGWGRNNHGQLGTNDTVNKATPVQISVGTKFVNFWTDQKVQPFAATMFAKDDVGQLWAWGKDSGNGALGTGTVGSLSTPTLVLGGIDFVKVDTADSKHTIGLSADGVAYSWGLNTSGQLGDNTIVSKSSPTSIIGGLEFIDVDGGGLFSYGLTKGLNLYSWGDNLQGQLGIGSIFPRSSPVAVSGLGQVRKMYAALQTGYAVSIDHFAYAWGFQDALFPILGINSTVKVSVPTLVTSAGEPPVGIGGVVAAFVKPLDSERAGVITKHAVSGFPGASRYAWGDNGGGSLGINSATPRVSTATFVSQLSFKVPAKTSDTHEIIVAPGDVLTISYAPTGFFIPEKGLSSTQFCRFIELEWVG